MRFARTPITVGRTNEEMLASSYELEDKVVKVGAIQWGVDAPDLSVREGRRNLRLNWGGDAYNHLVKDLKLADMDDEDEVLLRLRGDTVVGGLTPSYYSVSNKQIIDALDSLGLTVTLFKLHPSRSFFFARATRPQTIDGERYAKSVCITNSETGYKRLNIRAGVLRLVCVNGLVRADGDESVLNRLHMAKNFEEGFNLEAQITSQLAQSGGLIDAMEETREWVNPVSQVDAWIKSEFGARQQKAIYDHLGFDPEVGFPATAEMVKRYDILNSVTQLHEEFPRSAVRWMELGGAMLDRNFEFRAETPAPAPVVRVPRTRAPRSAEAVTAARAQRGVAQAELPTADEPSTVIDLGSPSDTEGTPAPTRRRRAARGAAPA